MMPCCSLLTLAIVVVVLLFVAAIGAVVGQVLWAALCVGFVYTIRPAGKRAKWIAASIPLFLPMYLVALVALVWVVWPDKYDAYQTAFHTAPSQSVVLYDGQVEGWADSVEINLHFKATPADIHSITTRNQLSLDPGYAASNAATLQTRFGQVPLAGKETYTGDAPIEDFSGDDAVLVYDPVTGEAWYVFDGTH